MKNQNQTGANVDDFALQSANAKSSLQGLIKNISKEVRRQKLSYPQLKYIFKVVRDRCEVVVPNNSIRKLYELPSSNDLERFYSVIDSPIHKLMFEVLEATGLRVAELCSLRVERIDFKSNLVFVSEGKGRQDRVTVIGNRLLEKLAIYLEGRNNKFLFESNRHAKFTSRRIEQLCHRYKSLAGIVKNLTPHTFRHVWNTRLAEAGVSKEKRAILAGHSNEKTQDIYTHLGVGGVKAEVIAILDRCSDSNG